MRKQEIDFDQDSNHNKRWTRAEDLRLIRQVNAFPQNLHKCFMIVAEELGRTENGVAGRWYNKLSKDPANVCFFISQKSTAESSKPKRSIWQRFLNLFKH